MAKLVILGCAMDRVVLLSVHGFRLSSSKMDIKVVRTASAHRSTTNREFLEVPV